MRYKVVAYHNDTIYTVGIGFASIAAAEKCQARFYAAHPGVDFYIE